MIDRELCGILFIPPSHNNIIDTERPEALTSTKVGAGRLNNAHLAEEMGNSSGVIIPKPFLAEIGAQSDEDVDMAIEDGRIVISAPRRARREGWAEASRAIAEAEDDPLVWPEFGNADDATLTW